MKTSATPSELVPQVVMSSPEAEGDKKVDGVAGVLDDDGNRQSNEELNVPEKA